jgi:O-antigen/teichoic acid export membrane protein
MRTHRFETKVFVTGLRYAAKAHVVTLLGLLVLRGNVFLLQHYYGAEEVGYYSIAAQLADALSLFPVTVSAVLFPALVKNPGQDWHVMRKALLSVMALMGPLCLLAALSAGFIIKIAFGKEYLPAVPVFYKILPGTFFLALISIISQYLSARGFPLRQVVVWVVAFAVLIVVSGWLIPQHAGQGAAMALSATYGMLFVLMTVAAVSMQAKGVRETQ